MDSRKVKYICSNFYFVVQVQVRSRSATDSTLFVIVGYYLLSSTQELTSSQCMLPHQNNIEIRDSGSKKQKAKGKRQKQKRAPMVYSFWLIYHFQQVGQPPLLVRITKWIGQQFVTHSHTQLDRHAQRRATSVVVV